MYGNQAWAWVPSHHCVGYPASFSSSARAATPYALPRCWICIHQGLCRGDGWCRISTSCSIGSAPQEGKRVGRAGRMPGVGGENGARIGMEARLLIELEIHEMKRSSQDGCHPVLKDLENCACSFHPHVTFIFSLCGGINPYTLTARLGPGDLAHYETSSKLDPTAWSFAQGNMP